MRTIIIVTFKTFFATLILLVLVNCSEENDPNPLAPSVSQYLANIKYPLILSNDKVTPLINARASRGEGVLTLAPQGGGSATLLRNKNGISVQIHSTGLTPGNAYTAWFIAFEEGGNPDHPIVVHAAGNIVGASGNSTFAGHLSTGPIGAANGMDILDGGDGNFNDPEGSLVVIHVVFHGPAGVDGPGTIPENIHEFTGTDGLAQEWVFDPS